MNAMNLTFAELRFVVSLVPNDRLDIAARLGFAVENAEALEASGLASLLIREECAITGETVTLTGLLAEIADSFGEATECVRVAVLEESNASLFQIFGSDRRRLMVVAIGHGVFECHPMVTDDGLVPQAAALVDATLRDANESIVLEWFHGSDSAGMILDSVDEQSIDRADQTTETAETANEPAGRGIAEHLSRLVAAGGRTR